MNYFKYLVITVLSVLTLINSTGTTLASGEDVIHEMLDEAEKEYSQTSKEIRQKDSEIRDKQQQIDEAKSRIGANQSQIRYWRNSMRRYVYRDWFTGEYIRIKPEDLPDTAPDRISPHQDYKSKKHKEVTEEERLDGKPYHKFIGEESNFNTPEGKKVKEEIDSLQRENKKLKKQLEEAEKALKKLKQDKDDLMFRLKLCRDRIQQTEDLMRKYYEGLEREARERQQQSRATIPQTDNSNSQQYAAVPLSIKVEIPNDTPQTNPALIAEYLLSQSNTQKTHVNQVNNDLDETIDTVAKAKTTFNENRGSYSYTDNYVYFSTDSLGGLNIGDHVHILSSLTKDQAKNNDKNKKNNNTQKKPQTTPCNNQLQSLPLATSQEPETIATPANDPPVVEPCEIDLETGYVYNNQPVSSPCSMNNNNPLSSQNNIHTPTLQ